MATDEDATNAAYADGMRWTCEQAGHPRQHPDDGACICGTWARHVEAGALVIDCTGDRTARQERTETP